MKVIARRGRGFTGKMESGRMSRSQERITRMIHRRERSEPQRGKNQEVIGSRDVTTQYVRARPRAPLPPPGPARDDLPRAQRPGSPELCTIGSGTTCAEIDNRN